MPNPPEHFCRAAGISSSLVLCGFCCAGFVATVPAFAQIRPSIAIKPWEEKPHWADTVDELLIFDRGHTKDGDEGTRTFHWDSSGRIKFDREDSEPKFALGYSVLTLDIDSSDSLLNGAWNDVSLAGIARLGELHDDWKFSLVGGMGTANDGHWSNDDALYGVAILNVEKPLAEASSLHFGIFYNGSTALFPDIPKPYLTYTEKFEQVDLTLGLPESFITYRPLQPLTLELGYAFPVDVEARATYEFIENFSAFVEYKRTFDSFYIDGRDHRRLFQELDRVVVGVRWVTEWFDLGLGVGYALNQEYRTGFDIRDLDDVGDISEQVFALIRLQGTF